MALTAVCCLILLPGCATLSVTTDRPAWIAHPKSDDSIYMYRVGHASGQRSSELARKAAYKDALAQISKSIMSSVTVRGLGSRLSSSLRIRDAEIMPGCIHMERSVSGHNCWVQISYPLSEKKKIVEQVDFGEELNSLWAKAQSDMHRGAHEEVKPSLQRLISDYENAMFLSFDVDEAKLLFGDVYREQKDFLEARRWYENVEKLSTSVEWKKKAVKKLMHLPRAPRFWPMHDRLGGRKIALLCCIREGKKCERSRELTSVLMKDSREGRLESVDIAPALTAKELADVFDGKALGAAHAAASGKGADVFVAVLMDIDPKKRGKKTRSLDMEMPVMDTQVIFLVTRVSDSSVIYDGIFKEIAGTSSDARLAKHAATILIQNYLVPNCPRIP